MRLRFHALPRHGERAHPVWIRKSSTPKYIDSTTAAKIRSHDISANLQFKRPVFYASAVQIVRTSPARLARYIIPKKTITIMMVSNMRNPFL